MTGDGVDIRRVRAADASRLEDLPELAPRRSSVLVPAVVVVVGSLLSVAVIVYGLIGGAL